MIIRRAGTAVGICEMTCQTLCAPENTLTSLARQLLDSCTRVLFLRLLFACVFVQRVSLRCSLGSGNFDSLGCGHFDTFGTAIETCVFRHCAGGTMKFAELSNKKPLGKPLPRHALKICSILSLPGWHHMSWTSCMASWSGREG
jgi:hypothetical protein